MNAIDPPGGPGPRPHLSDETHTGLTHPHVDKSVEGKPVQASSASPRDVAVSPSNASGSDTSPSDEQPKSVDGASMYDHRPEEDKDN